ncbi:heme oxygenase [Paenibacillus barengoltzii]|uniref:Heme oxygenase (Staphylobilin-producing) n=1 Tax=Paenibacillus barengoltzii J12 TaxID=935846 RepID=A0ABY1LWY1_9BACL|nr:heme oxygenase [Paenibacillus barengoltzii]SMF22617.1 heme oxygenase (staphylobilin-producing) [Paenibacillus barengoltzii J12]
MIVVTNRIKVKKGMGAVMAPGFTASGSLDQTKGLVKVEVLLAQHADHDELNVNMHWESMDDFTAWRNSDSFKEAHKRPEPGTHGEVKESPILESQLITYEVASLKEIAK